MPSSPRITGASSSGRVSRPMPGADLALPAVVARPVAPRGAAVGKGEVQAHNQDEELTTFTTSTR